MKLSSPSYMSKSDHVRDKIRIDGNDIDKEIRFHFGNWRKNDFVIRDSDIIAILTVNGWPSILDTVDILNYVCS